MKKAFHSEPLTPNAFRDPNFGPKQVCAGASVRRMPMNATLRLAMKPDSVQTG